MEEIRVAGIEPVNHNEKFGGNDKKDTGNGNRGNDTETPASGRGRKKKKSTVENLEWLTEKPEEIKIVPDDEEKKEKPKKKKTQSSLTTKDNIFQLFTLVGTFAGDIWKLSESESESLSIPIDSIMKRYKLNDKLNEYGDIVSLTITSLAIFAPRIIISINDAKRKTKGDMRNESEGKVKNDTGKSNSKTSLNDTITLEDILASVS